MLLVCRDGLERVQVADTATMRELRQQISASLNIPEDSVVLSTDPKLVSGLSKGQVPKRERRPKTVGVSIDCVQLTSKDPVSFTDLRNPQLSLASAGVRHGDIVSDLFSCCSLLSN